MQHHITLDADLSGSIARITLNRPDAANAMNHDMVTELSDGAPSATPKWWSSQARDVSSVLEAISKTPRTWWPGVRGRKVFDNGDVETGIWTAGTVMGLIHDIPTVDELISRIVSEAEDLIIGRLARLVH